MKLIVKSITILLLINTILFAQSILQVRENKSIANGAQHELQLDVTLNAQLRQGFVLKLPAPVRMTPRAVQAGTENLWLKQSTTQPRLANVAHWQFIPDGILFLLAPTSNAAQLSIRFDSVQPSDGNDAALTLHPVRWDANQLAQAGPVLARVVISQANNR